MKNVRLSILLTFLLIMIFVISTVEPVFAAPKDTVRVWVQYRPGKNMETYQVLNNAKANFHYDFPELESYVVTLPAIALNGILNNPFVVDVEDDPERYPISVNPVKLAVDTLDTADTNGQIVPWGIDAVQARDVWDVNRDGTIDPGAPTGSNRTVCIVDTGYYEEHEDLPVAIGGYSQVDDNWARDGYGHGSHVAGTIAAENDFDGVVGVTPGTVNLFIIKYFADSGAATNASDLVDAVNRCTSAGANVISMSLGGGRANTKERTAFQNAYNAGILNVAAAGNDQETTPGALSYPASYTSVISVAAIDESTSIATFSQQNTAVELAAPGVAVLSTLPFTDVNTVSVDGISFSANHIEFSGRGSASGALVNGGLCDVAGSWSGKVVLCERGSIDFYTKVINVQNGGGSAALIYNNEPGNFFGTLGDGNTSMITGVSLSQEDGQYLVANKIGATASVNSVYTWPASGYEAWDGTSMATPHVSAVAALIWSANPSWTNVQIREALTATAIDLGTAGKDIAFGYGLVQAKAALDYLGGGTPVNTAPIVSISSPSNGASFTSGSAITFSGVATDAEQGPLSSSLVWTSNISGVIGSGASFSTVLPVGTHIVTASVTDDGGLTGTASVTFTVTDSPALALSASVVTNKDVYINGEKVTITVTVLDQGGSPVSSATVNLQIITPIGAPKTLSGLTGTAGTVSFSYRISTRKTGTGTYYVNATALKTGYSDASASTSFFVQ